MRLATMLAPLWRQDPVKLAEKFRAQDEAHAGALAEHGMAPPSRARP